MRMKYPKAAPMISAEPLKRPHSPACAKSGTYLVLLQKDQKLVRRTKNMKANKIASHNQGFHPWSSPPSGQGGAISPLIQLRSPPTGIFSSVTPTASSERPSLDGSGFIPSPRAAN